MRKVLVGSALVLVGGLTLPKAFVSPSSASEPATCGNTDVTLSISKTVLWPPNHKIVPISLTAADSDSDKDMVNVAIGTITNSDETSANGAEINGTGQPDVAASDEQGSGQMASFNDPGSHTFSIGLAAERSGHDNGSGRTYSIPVMCSESGGTDGMTMGTATMTVFVPHDQGQK